MPQSNQVSFKLSPADQAEIRASIQVLQTKLLPHLITLSPEERNEILKLGDKSIAFVEKSMEYCQQNPELAPQYLDTDEFANDYQAVAELRSYYQPLVQITQALSDTIALSGSEAFLAALMFYHSIKNAVLTKIQKAETIYKDLSARFPGRPKKTTETKI